MDSSIENAEEIERSRDFFKELFKVPVEKDPRGEFFRQLMKKEQRRQIKKVKK